MAYALQDLLHSETITGVISRVAAATGRTIMRLGMSPGGRASRLLGDGRREFSFDIFDNVRAASGISAPMAPATRIQPKSIGKVTGSACRLSEMMELPYEKLHYQRRIGSPVGTFDAMGAEYIARQTKVLGQRASNWRTALTVGALRDTLYINQNVGTASWYASYTSGANTIGQINFQVPSGNKSQLNMLNEGNIIDVPWSNPSANIPLHLTMIDRAFQRLTGDTLKQVWIDGRMWQNIINNEYVITQAGTSSSPFSLFDREVGTDVNGKPVADRVGRISSIPFVDFVISDEIFEVGDLGAEAVETVVPDGYAYFLTWRDADPTRLQWGECGEPLVTIDGGSAEFVTGLRSYAQAKADPARYCMFMIDNGIPVPYVPKSWAYAQLVF
jgi:hypothetical protein